MYLEQEQQQRQSLTMRLSAILAQWINWLLTLLRQPFQAVETLLVGVIGVWSLVFFLNPNLFDVSSVYGPMAERGTPGGWGRWALVPVGLWLAALVTRSPVFRYGAQVLIIGWYSYLTLLFASAGQITFAVGFHALGLVYAVWVLWRYAGRKRAL